MPTLDSVKERARHALVDYARRCVASDRLPLIAKVAVVNLGGLVLRVLGIADDETPVETDYGTKFLAGRNDSFVTSWLRFRGAYEPVLSEFIIRHVAEGDICVDAGANIGYFSVLLAKQVRSTGKVIAIEAAPDNARRLRANVDLNGVADIVDVVELACAPQKGAVTFYLHPQNDGWARLRPPAEGDPDRRSMGKTWIPVTVAADTLTSIVGEEAARVSFVKLDVEGAETAITPEIAAAFSHPRLVVALEARGGIEATLMPFREKGFRVYDLHNNYHWIYERKIPAITEADYRDFYDRASVDVLLSRQPLALL